MVQGWSCDLRLANQSIASLRPSHWFRHVQVNHARPMRLSSGTWVGTTGKTESLFQPVLLRRGDVCLELLGPILPPQPKRVPANGVNNEESSSERERERLWYDDIDIDIDIDIDLCMEPSMKQDLPLPLDFSNT